MGNLDIVAEETDVSKLETFCSAFSINFEIFAGPHGEEEGATA
jgi:hypothetical protein